VIRKTACDAFYRTDLERYLKERGIRRLIVTGCATDFCVDTTVRSAASRDFEVLVAADGHTTADRPHLDAATIIRHHNYMWENLILPGSPVTIQPTKGLMRTLNLSSSETVR
jgi:nicotinamidase-related amidase